MRPRKLEVASGGGSGRGRAARRAVRRAVRKGAARAVEAWDRGGTGRFACWGIEGGGAGRVVAGIRAEV